MADPSTPGAQTSEYQLTVVASAVLAALGAFGLIDPTVAASLVTSLVGVFTGGRTILKSIAAKKKP